MEWPLSAFLLKTPRQKGPVRISTYVKNKHYTPQRKTNGPSSISCGHCRGTTMSGAMAEFHLSSSPVVTLTPNERSTEHRQSRRNCADGSSFTSAVDIGSDSSLAVLMERVGTLLLSVPASCFFLEEGVPTPCPEPLRVVAGVGVTN